MKNSMTLIMIFNVHFIGIRFHLIPNMLQNTNFVTCSTMEEEKFLQKIICQQN